LAGEEGSIWEYGSRERPWALRLILCVEGSINKTFWSLREGCVLVKMLTVPSPKPQSIAINTEYIKCTSCHAISWRRKMCTWHVSISVSTHHTLHAHWICCKLSSVLTPPPPPPPPRGSCANFQMHTFVTRSAYSVFLAKSQLPTW
jgi:hypothetical protein